MREFLGKLTVTISIDDKGQVEAFHETELSPLLDLVQENITGAERKEIHQHRVRACQAVADFFCAIRDHDKEGRMQ